jgi:chromosome segregation ATPase
MAKKSTETFEVPSLESTSPEYAALVAKRSVLLERQSALRDERREVERQIKALPAPTHRTPRRVAELLGDEPETDTMLQKRLAEIRSAEQDLEDALEIVRRRLAEARGPASVAVCAAVRPEYTRRVKAMVAAVAALREARENYESLLDDFIANDIAWTSLIPMQPTFAGDRHDGHLDRYLRAAKEAGYSV